MVSWTTIKKLGLGVLCLTTVAACAGAPVSRNAPFEVPLPSQVVAPPENYVVLPTVQTQKRGVPYESKYSLRNLSVHVPQDLRVSEANLYYPIADIVWRGDPHGDRRAQVKAIFEAGIAQAQPDLKGPRAVDAQIVVQRFHSLTEKTRYTVGGVHSINFTLTLRDVETGVVLVDRKPVKADLNGFGGRRAIEADRQGRTMKKRIQTHLSRVIWAEMSVPGGWADQDKRLEIALGQI